MRGEPPSSVGASQPKVIAVYPVKSLRVGFDVAPGASAAIRVKSVVLGPESTALVANTENLYEDPFVNPLLDAKRVVTVEIKVVAEASVP